MGGMEDAVLRERLRKLQCKSMGAEADCGWLGGAEWQIISHNFTHFCLPRSHGRYPSTTSHHTSDVNHACAYLALCVLTLRPHDPRRRRPNMLGGAEWQIISHNFTHFCFTRSHVRCPSITNHHVAHVNHACAYHVLCLLMLRLQDPRRRRPSMIAYPGKQCAEHKPLIKHACISFNFWSLWTIKTKSVRA